MQELMQAYNAWCTEQYILWEKGIESGAMNRARYHEFIETTKNIHGFLLDFTRQSIRSVTVNGIHHEGEAINVAWACLSQIKEYSQLSFDARGELAVTVAGLLMDALDTGS